MSFNIFSMIFSFIFIGLIVLFFFGLYKYVANGSRHVRRSEADLRRIEEKLDYIIYKINENSQEER